jgi:hypothetical protein
MAYSVPLLALVTSGWDGQLLTRDKAKRITVNIAKLPDVVRK